MTGIAEDQCMPSLDECEMRRAAMQRSRDYQDVSNCTVLRTEPDVARFYCSELDNLRLDCFRAHRDCEKQLELLAQEDIHGVACNASDDAACYVSVSPANTLHEWCSATLDRCSESLGREKWPTLWRCVQQ